MSERSLARIPYIPLFGTIAQFQLNKYNHKYILIQENTLTYIGYITTVYEPKE